jgi:ABC-type nitrate/sulfonate/bicarbonate transport system substrate-binding protein
MAHPTSTAQNKVSIVYAEATGSINVLLAVAQQQAFFKKFGVDAQCIAARGAVVPRLTSETPIGMIGEPVALLQAADGADLRIIASFSDICLSGHLVTRPEFQNAEGLRGKRVGVRVIGAGLWISTILALEQLGLDPQRDGITTVPIGSPVQILHALEEGTIDGALVSVKKSHELQAKGFSVLLKDYPADISSYEGGMVAASSYLLAEPDVVENVVMALIEALAFSLGEKNKMEVMDAFKTSLNIVDADTAASNLAELKRKPYASLMTLRKMQRIMASHDARVLKLNIEDLVEDRFVRKLDENGTIDHLYAAYGVK